MNDIHNENIVTEDFENICRSCMSCADLQSIFNEQSAKIVNMFKVVTNLEIQYNDELPSKICQICIQKLDEAFGFRTQCEQTHLKLCNILKRKKTNRTELTLIKQENSFDNNIEEEDSFNNKSASFSKFENGDEGTVLKEKTVCLPQTEECIDFMDSVDEVTQCEQAHSKLYNLLKRKKTNKKEVNLIKQKKSFDNNIIEDDGLHPIQSEHPEIQENRLFISSSTALDLHTYCKKKENNVARKSKVPSKRIKLITCKHCHKTIQSKSLKSHMISVHSNNRNRYSCQICQATFALKGNYKRHLKIHTGDKQHKCPYCNKCFIQSYHLKVHLPIHTQKRPYKCKICDKTFNQSISLILHEKTHGDKSECMSTNDFVCGICNRGFYSFLGLNAHSRQHCSPKTHACDNCDKEFKTYMQLSEHEKIHSLKHGEKAYLCINCDKTFSTSASLNVHKKSHEGVIFLCHYCGKSFSTNQMLITHLRSHTNERPFECDKCSKTFTTKSFLKIHNRAVHTGERPYSCDICSKRFNLSAHLVKHMRTHTGEKPFTCSVCGKKFANKYTLTVHKRIHSGETPYVCFVCNKGFYDSSSMKKHQKNHNSADIKVKNC